MSNIRFPEAEVNRDLLAPVFATSRKYYIVLAILLVITLATLTAWGLQIFRGIGVVGKNRPAFWGLYITSFVFWIGISHAGTLISAILRVVQAEWRRPITRCAEAITTFALFTGALFPIVHLGRSWKFFWMIPYPNERYLWPNFQSPLMWDFMAISTYLISSVTYLYLPMIPDMAVARDKARGRRKTLYRVLALGWRGTELQWSRLEKAISTIAILIIPIAVSVHTIVSWDFAMTVMPMWHSTIFGPYFVVGAIFSGIAALLVAMVLIRRFCHLEKYLLPVHFDNLGKMLLTMSLLWVYFTFAEYLVTWYGNQEAEMAVFWSKVSGPYAPLFWTMVVCNFIIPFPILAIRQLRTVSGVFVASIGVLIGMWLERFLIIVPTLVHPYLPFNYGSYWPSITEATIAAGSFAGFVLLYFLFVKISPMVSIWEFEEGQSAVQALSPLTPDAGGARGLLNAAMPQTCLARFDEPAGARAAIWQLKQLGVATDRMDVMTCQPIHGEPLVPEQKTTRLRTWTLGGAAVGVTAGLFLAIVPAISFPLVKGGMPIVAPLTVGIVAYETMMLGAVLATLLGFLIELRLPNWRPLPYDESISDGGVLLAVHCPEENGSAIHRVMSAASAREIGSR